MRKFNNRSGFTLIEIIVVLIIVGILAAIALPNLFSNINKSKGAEALSNMSTYKSVSEGCVQAHEATAGTSCTWALLGLSAATGNFAYTYLTAPANGAWTYTIKATNNVNAADVITLTRGTLSTDGYTCQGGGNYGGMC